MNAPTPELEPPVLEPETLPASPWRRLLLPACVLAALLSAVALWASGRPALATALTGTAALAAATVLGVASIRGMLFGSHGIVGVARAVVEEAAGSRGTLLLVLTLVIALPALPLVLDPSERLEYRIQFLLNWSLSGASFLLTMVTIALACGTVCGDIVSQRIHMTLVKPIERWQYLLGKWLGIVMLDAMLVMLVGIGVYAAAEALRRTPATDAADRRAVDEQVFTARSVARPVHPRRDEFERTVAASIEQMRKDDPGSFEADPAGARRRILAQRVLEWHTVTEDAMASFLFEGLAPERADTSVVQLRLKPFADNVGIDRAPVRFAMWLNDRPFPMKDGRHEEFTLVSGRFHTIELPVAAMEKDGTLKVSIANRNLVPPGEDHPTSISFSPGKGLEILYRDGGFTGNYLRGLGMIWAKLAMLAAAALAAASWLQFPIAVLASLMVYVSAVAQGFLADAIDIYTGVDRADATVTAMIRLRWTVLAERLAKLELWESCKTFTSYAADAFLSLVPSFGVHDGITEIATGRLLAVPHWLASLGELGLLYPAVLLAVGWLVLERRDLVDVSGS